MDEVQRLASLKGLAVLDTPSEATFDRLTQLAAATIGAPVSVASLVDEARVWLKSRVGCDVAEVPREGAFCHHTIASDGVFVVGDAQSDARFESSILVVRDGVRFYAGAPIVVANGAVVGAICVLDTEPRASFSLAHKALLQGLAAAAGHLLDLRRELLLREQAERELAERARLVEIAEDVAGIGHWRLDLTTGQLYLSPTTYKIYGLNAAAGCPPVERLLSMFQPGDRRRIEAQLAHAKRSGASYNFEATLTRADGAARCVRADGRVERDGAGEPAVIIGVLRDITAEKANLSLLEDLRREADQRAHCMRQLAETDALTGLLNRRAFLDVAERVLADGAPLRLSILDLDHFKAINDRLGHEAGDRVLEHVGHSCLAHVAPGRVFGRIGGEEFALLTYGSEHADAETVIEALRCALLATPLEGTGGAPLAVTFSAGLALGRRSDDWRVLFARADRALYEAKNKGRDRLAIAA